MYRERMRAFWLLSLAACFSSAPAAQTPCPSPLVTTRTAEPAETPRDVAPAAALRALDLPERCALASLLGQQLVELMEWMEGLDKYAANDRAVLVVFIEGSEHKLLDDAEQCPSTEVRLVKRAPRRVRVEHAGPELVGTPHLMLSLASERSSASQRRFTFTWALNTGYYGNAPAQPGQPSVRSGTSHAMAPAPTIELEVERRGDTLEVRRFEVVMWRRSAPAF